jgi:hypothetical protein
VERPLASALRSNAVNAAIDTQLIMLPFLPLASPASRELLVLAFTVKSVRELKPGSASIQEEPTSCTRTFKLTTLLSIAG